MTDPITAGNILVQEGMNLPKSLLLQSESNSNGWAAVKDARSTFEKAIQEAGWTFFFMAGEIKANVFGFDRQKARRAALNRLIADAKIKLLRRGSSSGDNTISELTKARILLLV